MPDRSKLVTLRIRNLGCIGPEGLEIALDDIVCLVGRNNTGKSTVLRAYELAQGSKPLSKNDLCQWTPAGDFPEVELVVHIPDGILNVDEKWKKASDGLKLVRSRWQWKEIGSKPIRQTWDPAGNNGDGEWAEDDKAGGADNVFNSRLPEPLHVSSLGDAYDEHGQLLKLILGPVAKRLKELQETPGSPLHAAIAEVSKVANEPVAQYQADIDRFGGQVRDGFKGVFPEFDIKIKVAMETISIDAQKSLAAGSSVRFIEPASETGLEQQGTGSRRAMFWSLLQVRNGIVREQKAVEETQKQIAKLLAMREKEEQKQKPNPQKIEDLGNQIRALEETAGNVADQFALPGYILLIDEPENALHPMAVRAAREHLYTLARDPDWQVMLSTHSPYFIDPLQDHTTIVRLERTGQTTAPRTFRASTVLFAPEDKSNLRALIQLDSALAEMFFGSYPIIVEGDTELASFIAAVVQAGEALATQVTLVPARGKPLIAPLVRLLTHFRIPFGVIHDADSPCRDDGKRNSAWTENRTIANAIAEARARNIEVRHRVSVPDFERRLGGIEETKDKPIRAYRRVSEHAVSREQVKQLFIDLYSSANHQPFGDLLPDSTPEDIVGAVRNAVKFWAEKEFPADPRFKFPD
jgi:ABC-type polar amino acid transport system ATPase subunit